MIGTSRFARSQLRSAQLHQVQWWPVNAQR